MPAQSSMGPAQSYLCNYNGYVLPGYVQSESFDSTMNLAAHYGPYIDGSPTEEMGLSNKVLTVTLKVWEVDYLTCKEQVEYASTILRSMRTNFAPLYLQFPDKHYSAMVRGIRTSKQAGLSYRTLDYEVEFECKPWLIGETLHTVNSDTDEVGRTLDNGGWTPTIVTLTGNSISGLAVGIGQPTGNIVTTGVSGMVIDTEAFTATISNVNRNDLVTTKDYRLYVGPGRTTFTVDGSASIEYYDRWYI